MKRYFQIQYSSFFSDEAKKTEKAVSKNTKHEKILKKFKMKMSCHYLFYGNLQVQIRK